MVDRRASLFSEIHRRWLKPQGFAKTARTSVLPFAEGGSVGVALECYPAGPGGPYRFSLELKTEWKDDGEGRIKYHLSLPAYVTKSQFWKYGDTPSFEAVAKEVMQIFETVGLPAIRKMQSAEGLAELFEGVPADVPIFWYYQSYLVLLNRLGRMQDGLSLLKKVIAVAPREALADRARELLAHQEALLHGVGI